MQLRELTIDEILEIQKNGPMNDAVYIAQEVLKLASQAICFHCRDRGNPQKTKSGWLHFYSENHSAGCKAAVIWEAPILSKGTNQ